MSTQQIRAQYGDNADAVLAQYPLRDYDSASLAVSAVQTDSGIVGPGLQNDRAFAEYVPVYIFEFADQSAPAYAPAVSFDYGAYHTGEIQYLFPLAHGATGTPKPLNDAQKALSDDMISYWSRFAAGADPNSAAAVDWPAYTDAEGEYQSLDTPKPMTGEVKQLSAVHSLRFVG